MAEQNQNPNPQPAASETPAGSTPVVTSPPAATPQPSTPAGGTISLQEHQRMLEKVRGEEKQKQFDALADKDRTIAQLTQDKLQLQGQVDALTSAATPNSGVDVKKVIEDVTRSAESVYRTSMTEMNQKMEKMEKQLRQSELDKFRERAIADAGGPSNLVVSLVRGNTEEEILASVQEAKSEYESIKARIGAPSAQPATTTQNTTTVTPPPTVTPAPQTTASRGAGTDLLDGGKSVKDLSPKEYAEKREELQKNIRSRYQPQPIRR
jgi:hypothetical protein